MACWFETWDGVFFIGFLMLYIYIYTLNPINPIGGIGFFIFIFLIIIIIIIWVYGLGFRV